MKVNKKRDKIKELAGKNLSANEIQKITGYSLWSIYRYGKNTNMKKLYGNECECCYMQITRDKYELPVRIADTAGELARMAGVSIGTVLKECHLYKKGHHTRFIKVNFDENC